MPKLTFLGAAGCVTGSKHLVEANGPEGSGRLLIDCGLFQGSKELRLRNWERLPVDPATIDWVVLTHAHIDHTGYLPRLVRDGFRGPIFANAATRDLCSILLPDSARIQEEDAAHAERKGYSKHHPALPLYTEEEAHAALNRIQAMPDAAFRISPAFTVRLHTAGHILGSTMIELAITENGRTLTVLFSGDVGRYDQPILHDPAPAPRCDYLVCESTYGDREHPHDSPHDALAEVITRVAKRGGAVVMPAFAVGRTQTLLYVLRQLENWQRIPSLPVYVDSPMASRVTDFYLSHSEDHDAEYTREEKAGEDPLGARNLHVTRSVEESKQINKLNQPCVIISASGMATGGRVLHHLARRLPDSRNAILLAGFQAQGSRGRALLEGARTVRIHGEEVPVKAEVVHLSQFSAHAGRSELLRWLATVPSLARPEAAGRRAGPVHPEAEGRRERSRGAQPAEGPRHCFLVHGEPAAAASLRDAVSQRFQWKVSVAAHQQSVSL